jgi:hypothetical protein
MGVLTHFRMEFVAALCVERSGNEFEPPGMACSAHAGAFLFPNPVKAVARQMGATSRGVAPFLADRLKSISQLPD